jgi:serine-type D-Ala-D-Ala carboxypeptidase/endopeptidase
LPAGVTVPTRDRVAITLRHLVLDSSGLPPLPPSIRDLRDPFAKYDEDALYRDLIQTELATKPGTQIVYSNLGSGLLGFALGRKIGAGYAKALETRIATPLGLRDTFVVVPAAAAARRAAGTDDELKPAGYWSWDALAGAGGAVSSMHDLLQLVDAELDAAAGGKAAPLRSPMRLTQESQLSNVGSNLGLGWIIDDGGRYWSSGTTGGFRSFVGFDPKTKRGIAVLASTAATLVDRIPPVLFDLLDGNPLKPWTPPSAEQLATYAGAYKLNEQKLTVVAEGKRLYLEAANEPRRRLSPVSDHEFWLDAGNAVAIFKIESGKVSNVVFGVGGQRFVASRVE